ncbi:hypothetical protein FOA43_003932 [Brettanomyces nanus]|uniref:CCR4-Not complex 3'-5'-exoribonuclease subunit Ccr4 n=1 Tax=Eeniella nana TaxID=13502 RepID=A0A875S6I9_EENNA|nr:uncharacterized protein FOA43_003932 [Brettanomyces nanus]QPG76543.1 hypothetical protein FOA43_003932 [Brettanomyces nanus]
MNVAPYKNTPGTTQFQGSPQYMYQGGYGAPLNDGYFHQQGQTQPEGLNPSKLLAQTLYQGQMGQPGQPGQLNQLGQQAPDLQEQLTPHHDQLQALQQQLQQIPGTPQQQQQLAQIQLVQQQQQQQQQQLQAQFAGVIPQGQRESSLLPTDHPQHLAISVDATTANSPHWQHQMQLAQVSRSSNIPHFYARNAASSSRRMTHDPDNSSQSGATLIEITKSVLSSVPEEEEITQQNEQRRPVTDAKEVDEEEEDQMIRIKENNTQLWTGLDLSGQQLSMISPRLFEYRFLRRLYLNGNMLTTVPKAILQLKFLRVLDLSSNLLESLPSELGMLFNLKYLYLFDNDLDKLPWEFGNLESLEFLGVEGNPRMDETVVSTISKKGTRGLIIHLRDDAPRLSPPKPRDWIPVGEDGEPEMGAAKLAIDVDLSAKETSKFTLMSYNTLCQHYATQKMYRYTPSWALAWEYRRKKLTEEISNYKAQVICLQEVETKTYEDYWSPLMEKRGYRGVFHCKGRAKTMSEKNAKKVDGCATFFKTDIFQLVDKKLIDYSGVVMTQDKFKKTEDLFNRFANKDNVALVLVLQHVSTGSKVIVANTHLHWDPEYNDVKTMQVAVLLDELQGMVRKYSPSREDINKLPMVICGDFNSQRDSAVYQLISQGVSKKHKDMDDRDYGRFTSEGFNHPFHLDSAYDCLGELPFTNFTPAFTEVIDYIWYSTQPLRVKGLLGKEDSEYTNKLIGFPTADCPSDHIPLIAEFEIRKQTEGSQGSRNINVDFGSGGYSRKT